MVTRKTKEKQANEKNDHHRRGFRQRPSEVRSALEVLVVWPSAVLLSFGMFRKASDDAICVSSRILTKVHGCPCICFLRSLKAGVGIGTLVGDRDYRV